MTQPISSVSNNDAYWSRLPADAPDHRPNKMCESPKSVVTGALCGNDTAVSNACRKALPGTIDAYVCDDRKLAHAQDAVEKTTWYVLKALFGRLARIMR
jgi:hypothetical protein